MFCYTMFQTVNCITNLAVCHSTVLILSAIIDLLVYCAHAYIISTPSLHARAYPMSELIITVIIVSNELFVVFITAVITLHSYHSSTIKNLLMWLEHSLP